MNHFSMSGVDQKPHFEEKYRYFFISGQYERLLPVSGSGRAFCNNEMMEGLVIFSKN